MRLPDGYGTVFPYLISADAPGLIAFLVSAFQAVELERISDDLGRVRNAQIQLGTTRFMVSSATAEWPAMPASYYIFVADADAAVALAQHHGGTLVMPVGDKPYGDRQGGVRDPTGNVWWVSQRLIDGPYR